MTETTATNSILYPAGSAPKHLVDPVAFALAMVGGPVITGILGAPVALIPTFAMVFGGPFYLLVGVPVMLTWMRRHPVSPAKWALLALCTHLCLFVPISLITTLTDQHDPGWPQTYLCFGAIFAPIWGAVSGNIYRRYARDFYKQTL